MSFENIAPAKVLLPQDISLQKWACIACDQYTSDEDYWKKLSAFIGDAPSTLKITFPEVYLGQGDDARIAKINETMSEYLASDLFYEKEGFVLVCREQKNGKRRLGVVLAVDLESYSFEKGAKPNIRATEGTILSRIPPRVKIRENAPLETPHIMLLINDAKKAVIEKLYEDREKLGFEKLYDFELNMGGGHITGYFIDKDFPIRSYFERAAYSFGGDSFDLAVGDGNHSLATAKTCYENLKKKIGKEAENSPARYALCEVVNLFDDGLAFEPIHRVLFGVDVERFTKYLQETLFGDGEITLVTESGETKLKAPSAAPDQYAAVQGAVDRFLAENGGTVDYVHGSETVLREGKKRGNVGIFMTTLKKEELFLGVARFGALPRKTFSMGEADEKRYYLECRKIK